MSARSRDRERQAHRACKSLSCNQGTPHDVLSGAHRDTRLQRSNIRTLQTTNTLAFVAGYTRARTRMHLLSYRVHAANVCKLWPVALVHAGELGVVSGVGNSKVTDWYVAEDNEEALKGSLLVREKDGIFDRL